jgi:hypothetical protein
MPYDTKGSRDSWLHACKPCPFRSRHVSMVCGERQISAVTFKVSECKAPSKPLLPNAAHTNQKCDQSYSSTDPDEVGFSSKQLSQHSASRNGSTLCADTSEVRTSYLRTPLEKSLVVHVEASAVSRPCTILPLRNGKVGVPHSGDRVETYAFDIKG